MSTHNVFMENVRAILMSTHNIRFYEELTKIILQLSSNTPFICSTVLHVHVLGTEYNYAINKANVSSMGKWSSPPISFASLKCELHGKVVKPTDFIR